MTTIAISSPSPNQGVAGVYLIDGEGDIKAGSFSHIADLAPGECIVAQVHPGQRVAVYDIPAIAI